MQNYFFPGKLKRSKRICRKSRPALSKTRSFLRLWPFRRHVMNKPRGKTIWSLNFALSFWYLIFDLWIYTDLFIHEIASSRPLKNNIPRTALRLLALLFLLVLAFFRRLYPDYLPFTVISAVRADAMGHFGFTALRASPQRDRLCFVMRPSFPAARFRMSVFYFWHLFPPLK